MTIARSSLVSLEATPYYHVISRCVRRAFLCGSDSVSGRSFEHRRGWIVERLALLESVFGVSVCAYAVMSNHYHLVLRLESSVEWSMGEVLDRWCSLYSGPDLVQRYRSGEALGPAELARVCEYADEYRVRLGSLSWFMRALNHPIACLANAEDKVTGHFWEGRFKSQALLDEQALLTCMAYVDLNPIRAKLAATPEASDFTSVQQWIVAKTKAANVSKESRAGKSTTGESLNTVIPRLLGFAGKLDDDSGLPFSLKDYLELVDWSGRAVRADKKGFIPGSMPPILSRLSIAPDPLLRYLSRQENGFCQVTGKAASIRTAVHQLGASFLKGISAANRLFPQLN